MDQHPTPYQLQQWLDGRLSEADSTVIEKHLSGCRNVCVAVLDGLPIGANVDPNCTRPLPVEGASSPTVSSDSASATAPSSPPESWRTWPPTPDDFATSSTVEPSSEVSPSPAVLGPAAAAPPSLPGYEILGFLDRGGMGDVYKARHVRLKRLVALKMIRGDTHADHERMARFQGEAELVARLRHPNIVQIYEVGEAEGRPFISLEFVDGGSLDRKLARTPLAAAPAARLVETLAQAMEVAHRSRIVHRDLKPSNVLLVGGPDLPVEQCTPKITDFGLAKQLDADSAQTQTGAIMGTPSYMAPEQAWGRTREIGPLSDVYALGAILYECLTGRPPFKAASPIETVEQVRNEEPVPPRRLQPKVPRDLETICLKCLDKRPSRRYASAKALADDLNRFLQGDPIHARRVRWWERAAKWARRRPTAAALIGVLVAVGLALPVLGLLFAAQEADKRAAKWKQEEDERRRVEQARGEVLNLLGQGQTAAAGQDWKLAEVRLDEALNKVEAERALEDLRESVEKVRKPVKDRLTALNVYKSFDLARDEALFFATWAATWSVARPATAGIRVDLARDEAVFFATLLSGETFLENRKTAQEEAAKALTAVGLSAKGVGTLSLGPSFTGEEKEKITIGCYMLLLMLAEIESRDLSPQAGEENKRKLRKALALLDRADELGVRTRAIHLRRARYLDKLNQMPEAEKESKRAADLAREIDLDPQDHFLVGHELYSEGKLEEANAEFRRALQLDPTHFWTHYFLSICSVIAGKPGVALAHLTICRIQHENLIWIYLLRGFALGQLEDYAAAETDFDKALSLLKKKPSTATHYVLLYNRGVMRVGQWDKSLAVVGANTVGVMGSPQGQGPFLAASALGPANTWATGPASAWAKGVDDLKQAAVLRPKRYQAQASLAEAYQLAGLLDEAAKSLDAAIAAAEQLMRADDLRPATLAQLHYNRARLHLQHQPPEDDAAVRSLEESARLAGNDDRPLRARADADRGRVLQVQESFAAALAAYDAALEADPKHVAVRHWRGEVLLVLHKYGDAAEAFDDYLEQGGTPSAKLYRQRGLARAKLNRHREAIDDYSRALDAKPKNEEMAPLLLERGKENLEFKAPGPALHDFTEALRYDPKSGDAHLGCAYACVKLGDAQKAMTHADLAVKCQPNDPSLWLGAARVYTHAGEMIKPDPGQEANQEAVRKERQKQALGLLAGALGNMPDAEQRRAYLHEVMNDPALNPLRGNPGFDKLIDKYKGGR
jgi:tetratricopeptide (TPR) repeat protein/tRNA A-37 threonylcarbamoyl transferase component Bud32